MKKVLPDNPEEGEYWRIEVEDYGTITTIEFNGEPLTLDIPNSCIELYYNGEEWIIV